MSGSDRYVVLGLAAPRRAWFREVATWATGGGVPIEFVKCLSAEEVEARFAGGRSYSALLVDDALPSLDRDLIEAARRSGCAVVIVGSRDGRWAGTGTDALLPTDFDIGTLLEVLERCAAPVATVAPALVEPTTPAPLPLLGRLITVVGPPGAGTSTVAASLATGLARRSPSVLLADLALDADQALLHATADIVPGITELAEAFRTGTPDDDVVRSHLHAVPGADYGLLLGLRRHRDWAALRPRAVEAAVMALRRLHAWTVADTDADLEGADACGSADVEDRNHLARHAVIEADLVMVVARPDVRGLRRLAVLVEEIEVLTRGRVPVMPVLNRASRAPRTRATLTAAVHDLCGDAVQPPVYLPARRRLADDAVDGIVTHRPLPQLLATAAEAVLDRVLRRPAPSDVPTPVEPGSLGTWTEEAAG